MSAGDDAVAHGGCQCGAARFRLVGEAAAIWVCHCIECRRQSASAFGISVTYPKERFSLTQGAVASWWRDCDSGRRLECVFCPVCGSRLWHQQPQGETLNVKGGTLDDGVDIARATHIWTARKLPGVVIPEGAVQFPGEPD